MQNTVLMFIHVMVAAVSVGGIAFSVFLSATHPTQDQDAPPEQSLQFKMIDSLAPLVLVCIFILIGTGVYYLLENYTDQVNLKPGYYNVFGMKVLFALAVFGLSIYQTFGLRPRISDLDLKTESKKEVPQTLETMDALNRYLLFTLSITVFFGIWLSRY
ncbi:MAG: hypothetical protein VYC17_04390 [Nitrospinota bacterium]|nr:hypothetical protein [Nitrospinota bacterium]